MDLIDRQAITEHIRNRIDMQDLYLPIHIIQLIDELPTIDAVPVVRCKDCQWWDDYYRECGSPNWYPDQDGCVLQPAGMFCGWAERKTDE